MADTKGSPSRLRSLRDSVKHITKRLSEGEADVIHRNDEQTREIEKLRVQIQSMEEEIRRLYQSRYQLDQATKQNDAQQRKPRAQRRRPLQPGRGRQRLGARCRVEADRESGEEI